MLRLGAVFVSVVVLNGCGDQRASDWKAECLRTFNSQIALMDQYRDSFRTDREAELMVIDRYVRPEHRRTAEQLLDDDWPNQFQISANNLVLERDRLCGSE